MRYSVLTFGCRVNQAESLAVEAELQASGAVPSDQGDADLVVVNSCSVTASADQGTRQAIRKIARENPAARIVVTGCYATREPAQIASLPGVVRVVPNHDKDGLVASLASLRREVETTAERYAGGEGPCGAREARAPSELGPGMGGRTAFTLRVQTGCEESCAYCIIPSTRGRSLSTAPTDLARDVQRLERAGYRDVTLTGVHVGAYGRDLSPALSLVELLERLVSATEHVVFRLGSLEPMDCPVALVDLATATPRIAPAFHLPLQHASDRVLRAMRRPYTLAGYERTVGAIRARLPHASITADVIVGFPGEDDEDADVLAEYIERSPLTQLHVFPYSDRPGTEASDMKGRVHGALVRARGARMRAIGQRLRERFRASQHGRVCRALAIEDGRAALTDNGLRVEIGEGHQRNDVLRLRLALVDGRLTGMSDG